MILLELCMSLWFPIFFYPVSYKYNNSLNEGRSKFGSNLTNTFKLVCKMVMPIKYNLAMQRLTQEGIITEFPMYEAAEAHRG